MSNEESPHYLKSSTLIHEFGSITSQLNPTPELHHKCTLLKSDLMAHPVRPATWKAQEHRSEIKSAWIQNTIKACLGS